MCYVLYIIIHCTKQLKSYIVTKLLNHRRYFQKQYFYIKFHPRFSCLPKWFILWYPDLPAKLDNQLLIPIQVIAALSITIFRPFNPGWVPFWNVLCSSWQLPPLFTITIELRAMCDERGLPSTWLAEERSGSGVNNGEGIIRQNKIIIRPRRKIHCNIFNSPEANKLFEWLQVKIRAHLHFLTLHFLTLYFPTFRC